MIDPSANAVIAQWPTAPATRPHGLALAFPLKPLRSELLNVQRLIPIFSCIRYDIAI